MNFDVNGPASGSWGWTNTRKVIYQYCVTYLSCILYIQSLYIHSPVHTEQIATSS